MSMYKTNVAINDEVVPLPLGAWGNKKGVVTQIFESRLSGEGRYKSFVSSKATIQWNDDTTTDVELWAFAPKGMWSDIHSVMKLN